MEKQEREDVIKMANKTVCNLILYLGRYGVEIDSVKNVDFEKGQGLAFFISVPNSSDLSLESGEAACGEALAKVSKEIIIAEEQKNFTELIIANDPRALLFMDYANSRTKVYCKIRNDHWTIEKEIEANIQSLNAAALIYGKSEGR